jgi:ATP-dependent DNA ligase
MDSSSTYGLPLDSRIKHNDFRLIARREGESVILRTRGGYNWAGPYPRFISAVLPLRVESMSISGGSSFSSDGLEDCGNLPRRIPCLKGEAI